VWPAYVVVALLRIPGVAVAALAAIVWTAALLVGSAIVLSLIHEVTVSGELATAALLSMLATAAWTAAGRPRPLATLPSLCEIRSAVRGAPVVAALVGVAVVALLFEAFLAVAVAPNEQDALLYHLPRAAYWVQNHTAVQFNAGTLGDPEVGNPPNAELMIAWTMVLSHSDRLADLVQWVFAWGFGLSIYLGTRLAGFDRRAGAFAAAVVAITPQPIMQAATAQNDVVAAALVAAGAVFLVRGLRDRSRGELATGAAALGLAVGTKGTLLYAAPGLVLLIGPAVVAWRPPARIVLATVAMLVAATAALGAFNYIQNIENTGDLTGGVDKEVAADYVRDNLGRDVARTGWNLLDLPGFGNPPWLGRAARSVSQPIFGHLRGSYYGPPTSVKTDVSEDESAYGPVGWLVLPPLVLGCMLLPGVRRPLRLCAAASCSYFVFLAVRLGYGPEEARLLMPGLAFAAPTLALLMRWRIATMLSALIAVAGLVPTVAFDLNKPLLRSDSSSILARDRLDQQLADTDYARSRPALRRLNRLVPAHARLAFLQQDDTIDYLLFGSHFTRYMIPLGDHEITAAMLAKKHADAIFIWNTRECQRCGACSQPVGLRALPLGAGAELLVPARS
jgi:hypothetical protein